MTSDASSKQGKNRRISTLRLLLRNRLAVFGLAVLTAIVVISLLAPWLPAGFRIGYEARGCLS